MAPYIGHVTPPRPYSAHKMLLITLTAGGAAALTTRTGERAESIPVQNGRQQTQGGGLGTAAEIGRAHV